jgi:hypothetical protein
LRYDNVACYVNGDEVGVTLTEKAIAEQVFESERYKGLFEALGRSHNREKSEAFWKLDDEFKEAELLRAELQARKDSFDRDWEAKWSRKHKGMVVNVMKKMIEKGELPPEDE